MDDLMDCFGIVAGDIDIAWPYVEPLLQRAMRYSDRKFDTQSIYEALIARDMQLWVATTASQEIKACAITHIVDYPQKTVMIIMFAAGFQMDKWLHFIHILKRYAQHNDCDSIEIYGRNGWAKKLAKYGYEQIHAVYRLDLTTGTETYAKDLH